MKRVFKIGGGLSALLVLLLVVLVFFRETIVIAYLSPPKTFSIEVAPEAPDYASLENWAGHPLSDETTDLRFPQKHRSPASDVDVFYVHPTTYFGPGEWNATTNTNTSATQNLEVMLAGHATIFGDCCRIYAPRYRQAHFRTFMKPQTEQGFHALELAYSDVAAAFEHYLEHHNEGRPFIVAGHSQGSILITRLLAERIDKSPLFERLVVALPIGAWIPYETLQNDFSNIALCEHADQTGCLIAYDTFGDGGTGRDPEGAIPHWSAKDGWEWAQPERTLCVNPLSWRADTTRAARVLHSGGMPLPVTFSVVDTLLNRNSGRTVDALGEPILELTWAECLPNGTLLIESQKDPAFTAAVDDRQMYHFYDWQLFYMNIKSNVEHRIEVFSRKAPDIERIP